MTKDILDIVLDDVMVLCFGGVAIALIMIWQTTRVYEYRRKLLEQVSTQANKDIDKGRDWMWRYEVFESVDFSDMVNKFWKKFPDFYTDKSFIGEK